MKTLKKVLSVLLVVVMCLTAVPVEEFMDIDFSFFSVTAKAASNIVTGNCGVGGDPWGYMVCSDNVKYSLDLSTGITADGQKSIHCKDCEAVKPESAVTIEKRTHNLVDTTFATPATCTDKGIMNQKCDHTGNDEYEVCSYTTTREIAALGHCDNDGDGKCDDCYEAIEQSKNCSHLCHKGGFVGFIWKIINFFNKLFGVNKVCNCGMAHY